MLFYNLLGIQIEMIPDDHQDVLSFLALNKEVRVRVRVSDLGLRVRV